MKRTSILSLGILLVIVFVIGRILITEDDVVPLATGDADNPRSRDQMEFLIQRDPVTNSIPVNIYRRERAFAKRIPSREQVALHKGSVVQELTWSERGPNNVGGRTRVLAADAANVGTLIAGSVAGGIWKTTNDGAFWRLTLAPDQIHTTSCIAQDVRTGRTHTWYVGTGEFRGSTTNNTRWGAFYRGDGVYKSTDNGESWSLLPSTISGTPQITDAFDFVWNVVINPANALQDEVFAATWSGIYRSTDGGGSWSLSQPSDTAAALTAGFATDVAVTSTGIVYAFTQENGSPRIWRSTDGVAWTDIKPANFPTSTGRIVFGPAPSNPNVVYVFIESANTTPAVAGHQLWKYTDGQPGTWENRGGNLPSGLSTQTGYDQLVHVKPDDENFVLIGGTNLYRSTNGFTSSAATTTIGGYPYWPNENHHPDLHSGAFRPGSPNVYYSGHDGGVSRTDGITLPSVVWTSLNNGYNVTQFYSVSISPDSGDAAIVAGAQDNGSQATLLPGLSDWTMVTGGDGTVVELAPAIHDRMYTQSQNGPLYRVNRAGSGSVSMRPSGSTRALFVNPIALDPNDLRVLYYGSGKSTSPTMWSGLWRNTDAPNATTTLGWTALQGTDVGSPSGWTRAVSCIGVSTSNASNVVYFGTTDGIVKRVDSARSSTPTVTDVTPPGLNGGTAQGGFVRAVAVDPANSNNALAAFGNYNFESLWYTSDGGQTWTDVEGNLAGPDGPSIRWATVLYIENTLHVFLATSIGVLTADTLNGSATIWTQAAANDIGNILIGYLDYRESDRTLAVGTHARGVFTTRIPSGPTRVDEKETRPFEFALHQNYPNPFNPTTNISFTLSQPSVVNVRMFDITGKEVAELVHEYLPAGMHGRTFSADHLASGVYFYRLTAGNASQTRKMTVMR